MIGLKQAQKETTPEMLAEVITVQISREQSDIDLHDKLAEILKGFEGKKLTKRVANKLKEQLPETAIVNWSTEFKWCKIYVWNFAHWKFDNRADLLIAYENEKESYDPNVFAHNDACRAEPAHKRQGARMALLNNPARLQELCDIINRFNAAYFELSNNLGFECQSEVPDIYAIEKAFVNQEASA